MDSAREACSLLHATGDLVRKVVLESDQTHLRDRGVAALLALLCGFAAHLEAEFDVAAHRAPGQQAIILEHHRTLATGTMNYLVIDEHHATVGLVEARDDAQQRGLTASAGTEQAHELVSLHAETDVIEYDELGPPDLRVIVEHLADFLYFQHPFGPSLGVGAIVRDTALAIILH